MSVRLQNDSKIPVSWAPLCIDDFFSEATRIIVAENKQQWHSVRCCFKLEGQDLFSCAKFWSLWSNIVVQQLQWAQRQVVFVLFSKATLGHTISSRYLECCSLIGCLKSSKENKKKNWKHFAVLSKMHHILVRNFKPFWRCKLWSWIFGRSELFF